jgi:glycosyltransferase involved in cell wall biosynthesis
VGEEHVTVVVCTYNRAALLRAALASLQALEADGFRYEIVVVDNASTDDTGSVIAEAARHSAVSLRGVREPRPGVACARNRGIREAVGPWIAFFDDDQVADRRWLRELLGWARARGARCVGGANRLLFPDGAPAYLSPVCRQLLSESVGRARPHRYSRRSGPGAGNVLLHRSVFDEVGGYDEGLREAGEDADLYRRIYAARIESWYTPQAVSYHVVPAYRLRPSYLRWKSLRNGGIVARRNHQEWGRAMFSLVLLARLGQALLLHLPRLLAARLLRHPGKVLGARCRLWRCEGYARLALKLLAPRLFPQRSFFSGLDFRAERALFPTT